MIISLTTSSDFFVQSSDQSFFDHHNFISHDGRSERDEELAIHHPDTFRPGGNHLPHNFRPDHTNLMLLKFLFKAHITKHLVDQLIYLFCSPLS